MRGSGLTCFLFLHRKPEAAQRGPFPVFQQANVVIGVRFGLLQGGYPVIRGHLPQIFFPQAGLVQFPPERFVFRIQDVFLVPVQQGSQGFAHHLKTSSFVSLQIVYADFRPIKRTENRNNFLPDRGGLFWWGSV